MRRRRPILLLLLVLLAAPAGAQTLEEIQQIQVDRLMDLVEIPAERFLPARGPRTSREEGHRADAPGVPQARGTRLPGGERPQTPPRQASPVGALQGREVEWTGRVGNTWAGGFLLEIGERRALVEGTAPTLKAGAVVRVRGRVQQAGGVFRGLELLEVAPADPGKPPRTLPPPPPDLAAWIRDYNPSLGAAAARRYAAWIAESGAAHGVDPRLLAALVAAESAFRERAVSPAGAMGLGQLMPGTAAALGVADPFEPRQNLEGAARYLAAQLRRFGDVTLALAAYNAGPGAVERYGGVPPYRETVGYVACVGKLYEELQALHRPRLSARIPEDVRPSPGPGTAGSGGAGGLEPSPPGQRL